MFTHFTVPRRVKAERLQLDAVYDYDPEVMLSTLHPGFVGFSPKDV